MAENIKRSYYDVIDELFTGSNSALEKYAKVRITQYEMNLWRKHGLPLKEVDKKAKRYFSVRFLGEGSRIDKSDAATLNKAFESLKFAVGKDSKDPSLCTGCHARCLKLVTELNEVLKADGLEPIPDLEKFLDFFTFNYEVRTDDNGQAIEEKPYGFVIRVFHDAENRRDFRAMLKMLRAENLEMSMQDIWRMINYKRKHSKKVK